MPGSKSSVDNRDVYYRLGKSAGYRARSAYKLLHLDEEFGLFEGVETAVDLCAAPGSWSQVLGQKLKPGKGENDRKVVSVDLQPMAPLPNITIMQTDITLPCTIPMVLGALGGRKADLVVCDGAPDVTGVHDLDAYLHSQLILAALTLSLTLLAPHGTLIFKIFLSPLDPQAAMLRSQLELFFSGPSNTRPYDEFDEEGSEPPKAESSIRVSQAGSPGFDAQGRRGGVWVRKPRSSRKGSGEAFIVCRNFDASKVPLPVTYPPEALAALAKQISGTLTLDSLSQLFGGGEPSEEWNMIKAYVGSGDLDAMATALSEPPAPQPTSRDRRPPTLHLEMNPTSSLSRDSSIRSVRALYSQPTPCEEPVEYFGNDSTRRDFLQPPERQASLTRRRPSTIENDSPARQSSLDSVGTPTSESPTRRSQQRPWERDTVPLPTPPKRRHENGLLTARDSDNAQSTPYVDGSISPALSTSSKTDIFFGTGASDGLPTPPRPLANGTPIGQGWPSAVRGHDRTASLPSMKPNDQANGAVFGDPAPTRVNNRLSSGNLFNPLPRIVSDSIPSAALSSLPTYPEVDTTSRLRASHARRESQHLLREHREAPVDDTPLHPGDVLIPSHDERQWPVTTATTRWKLLKPLGEGAFSAVWSAEQIPRTEEASVAVKLTSRTTASTNSRTRIAFLREVSVLRHISHPSIISFLASFSTVTHHCLVLEQITGGELFELVSNEKNRSRMLLPGPGDEVGEGLVRRIFSGIVKGVGWLHEVGVVHRDIKLENLLFTINPFTLPPTSTGSIPLDLLPTPLVKLTDFGLSRFINLSTPLLQTRCGSESFAAPEIIMGKPYDGRETDAWAMGVVLYALITDELPFDGPDEGRSEREERKKRMMRIAKGQYTWPEGLGSTAVRNLVGRLIVRDPKKRARVAELWDENWMSGPGGVKRPVTSDGIVDALGGKRRRVMDGFLLDEEVEDVAKAEMEV